MNDGLKKQNSSADRIFTIPNMLSFFRICLIPVIVWLYLVKKNYTWTVCILILSGVTDMVDGFIARRFNMISNLGKVLDPIADKLTQTVMLVCLFTRFPMMIVPTGWRPSCWSSMTRSSSCGAERSASGGGSAS